MRQNTRGGDDPWHAYRDYLGPLFCRVPSCAVTERYHPQHYPGVHGSRGGDRVVESWMGGIDPLFVLLYIVLIMSIYCASLALSIMMNDATHR